MYALSIILHSLPLTTVWSMHLQVLLCSIFQKVTCIGNFYNNRKVVCWKTISELIDHLLNGNKLFKYFVWFTNDAGFIVYPEKFYSETLVQKSWKYAKTRDRN